MSSSTEHVGRCFCGTVAVAVSGEPAAMGYCHCKDCRAWSAGPVNAFTLWPPNSVCIVEGADKLGEYKKTDMSIRKWCTVCGGHLLTEHPSLGLIDVYAAIIPDLPFEPAIHVHYESTVLPIRDGLPKQQDVPAEMGGSGVLMPEMTAAAR